MKLRKILSMTIAVLMLAALCVPAVSAADTPYVSLLDLPIQSWVMLDATSADEAPAYQPGIGSMKWTNGAAPGADTYYNVVNAKKYEKSIGLHVTSPEEPCEMVWDISGYDYDTFSATVGKAYSNNGGVGKEAKFYVYVDGELKAESPILTNIEDYYIEADIKGGKELKLVADAGTDGHANDEVAWCNPVIFNKDEVKIVSIELQGISYVTEVGKDIDLTTAHGLVTYDSGAEKQVAASEIEITNFYNDKEGKQTITVGYAGATDTQDIYVAAKGTYEYLCDMDWESYLMLDGTSEELLSNNEPVYDGLETDGYPVITGGVQYQHGIWFHPTSDASNNGYAEIVYDLGGYNAFHCTVGKGNDTYCYLGQYHVYLDGELVESSPVMYAGETYVFDIDTTGKSTISIAITGGEDSAEHNGFYWWDSTCWADPVLYKNVGDADVPAPAAPETEAPETAAPETEAPETEAPAETAAPETEAPAETAAPETEAPAETAAPETEAPAETVETPAETAPQTFDGGIILAAAAMAAAAGIVVSKKRK